MALFVCEIERVWEEYTVLSLCIAGLPSSSLCFCHDNYFVAAYFFGLFDTIRRLYSLLLSRVLYWHFARLLYHYTHLDYNCISSHYHYAALRKST